MQMQGKEYLVRSDPMFNDDDDDDENYNDNNQKTKIQSQDVTAVCLFICLYDENLLTKIELMVLICNERNKHH